MCECILEWRIVPSYFPVTVTLNSDLVSRIGITSLFFEVGIPNLVLMHFGMAKSCIHFSGHCDFFLWPSFRITVF